jgi:poly-gamma-glutamate capsule biosynthesis protein CapA/YwtB (metallophosphatase superfamily)
MSSFASSPNPRVRLRLLCATGAAILAAATVVVGQQPASNIGQNAVVRPHEGEPGFPLQPDQSIELATKIKHPFTVVGVGDLLEFQPFSKNIDPDVQFLVNLVRDADVAIGDLENEIYDFDNFGHAGGNLATKEVADDWANMGIDMVSRANNKVQRAPGVWENFRQVERVGIVHVGVAKTLPEARMARYFQTPKGLVGMVGISSDGGTDACCAGGAVTYVTSAQLGHVKAMKESILARRHEVGVPVDLPEPDPAGTVDVFGVTFKVGPPPAGGEATPARVRRDPSEVSPGPHDGVKNSLRLTLYHGVTAEQMAQLRAIAGDTGKARDLSAFGTQFRLMDRPGEHSFDMNPQDLREILAQIRTGKQASDLLTSNFHWHQNRYDFQHYSYDHFPADFEIKFAHAAIDQGVDFFLAQGVHTIKGVEIYKGKPIFYGVSNFVFQSAIMPQGKGSLPPVPGNTERAEGRGGPGAAPLGPGGRGARGGAAKDPDAIVGEHENQGFWQLRANLEALLAFAHYENGQLTEVRIYPVDLGQTPRIGTQLGIPKRPSPEVAKAILDEVIEYSKPFGTKIVVENGVGIIRIPPTATH